MARIIPVLSVICICHVGGTAGSAAGQKPEAGDRPNVVVIMADDMGYGDVQSLNPWSRIPTPAIDSLAHGGRRYLDAHSPSAVCTPTRYGLVTGRYCWRTRLKSGVLNGYGSPLMDQDRFTIASLMKREGYATGVIGKWHLGLGFARHDDDTTQGQRFDYSKPVSMTPVHFGFDHSMIIPASLDFPPYLFVKNENVLELPSETQDAISFPRFLRKGERSPDFDPETILDRLADMAVAFIDENAGSARPFFLYVPLTSPHKPVWPATRFTGTTGLGPYGDFIAQTDWTVGRILQCLDENSIAENTLVIFTSDNGSFMYRRKAEEKGHLDDPSVQAYREDRHRSNFIFRGTKADIYEAGHRVPFLVRWPAGVRPGSVSSRTICHVDIFRTVADLIDAEPLPADAAEDSFSFAADLMEEPSVPPRPPVINHSANGTFAIRKGPWKLILSSGSGGREQPRSRPFEKPYQLYNLDEDPREQFNLIERHPDRASDMESTLLGIRESSTAYNEN